MPEHDAERDSVNDPLVMFVLTRRTAILWGTPAGAIAATAVVLWADGWKFPGVAGVVGLAATIYGALLALFIFLASTASKTRLARDLEASSTTIKGSYSSGAPKQTDRQLEQAKKEFAGYVGALLEKYPKIPDSDIRSIGKADGSEGKGNRPIFIRTRHGHEYSVWFGGPKARYYVTDLGAQD